MEEGPSHPASTDQRHARIMAKLKDAVLARVPANVLANQQLTSYVERKLHAFFPHFDSPSHPPYASMIQTAIVKLNEEGGSSEGSISEFIRKEFEDLPWQHEAFLSHHLRKLCRSGEILVTDNERYVIVVKHGDKKEMGGRMNVRRGRKPRKPRFRGGFQRQPKEKFGEQIHLAKQDNAEEHRGADRRGMEMIGEWTKAKEGQPQLLENHCEVREQDTEATDQQIEKQSLELNNEERNNLHCQQIEVLEEPSNLQELLSEASEEHTCEQKNEVVIKQNKQQKLQVEVVCEKQKDDQVIDTVPNFSETSSQCLDCNGFSHSLEEPCMKLVKKKTEYSEEQLMENSFSLRRMKTKRNIVWEERKFTIICGLQAQKLSEPIIYGRRRVCKSDPNSFYKRQSPGQAKSPPLSKPVIVTAQWRTCKSNSENDQQHQLPGQAKNLSRCKPDTDTIMSDLLPTDLHHEDEQHQPEDHSQVQAQDTSMTMRDLLPSDQRHNDEYHLPGKRGRGQGRLQKAEGGRDCHDHDVLRVYFRRKRKGLLTYIRRKHKA